MREQLSAQLHLLLVNEFQDTDPLQVELVEALCGRQLADGKLFFVGDHKQSIYRFRGADPHVFRRLRDETPATGRQTLSLNFRSQPAILSFVNALFWHELGDDYEPLRPEHPQVSPTPAVEFLWAASPNGTRENTRLRRQREADWIARRLRRLLDSGAPSCAMSKRPKLAERRHARPRPAMSRSCFAPCPTSIYTKTRSAATASTTTWSAVTLSTPSRKSSIS